MKALILALMFGVSSVAAAADAAHVKAVHDLLAAVQAEKLLHATFSMSKYGSEAQKQAVKAKVDKLTPEMVYTRLATPVAGIVTLETATEMTRFYNSPFGKKVLAAEYNHAPTLPGMSTGPKPSPAEAKDMKRPEFKKADEAYKTAEPAIRHETFVLLQQLIKEK